MGSPLDDADLVLAARGGDQAAFGELFARWSDRCYDVARRIVHDDGRAAEVAQDVFLTAWQQLGTLRDPGAFGGWVLRSSRNRALNRLEKERRSVATAADAAALALVAAADAPERDVEAAMTAIDHRELVDAATVVLGEREASVLDLHLRHGLSAAELADELGVTTNNAHQLIFRTKKKLAAGIRAWVLVRGGRPACPTLAVALDDAGVHEFGRTAVGVIGDHVERCEECTERQASVLDPAALFAAVPVLAMEPGVRATVVEGLRAAGVPMGEAGATASGGGAGSAGAPASEPATLDPVPGTTGAADDPSRDAGRRRRAAVLAVAAVLLLIGGLAVVLRDGDPDEVEATAGPAPTTTEVAEVEAPSTTRDGDPRSGSTTTSAAVAGPGATTAPELVAPTTAPADAPATTAPPEGQPATTAPAATPTTTAPPQTTTTRPTTTTTAPPRVPTVVRFSAVAATSPGGDCPPARFATTLWWSSRNATSATIEATGVTTLTGLAASGTRVVCRFTPGAPPGGWKLTVTGPGGTATASA